MCLGPSLRWFQGSSKISHYMKLNELKFWEMITDMVFHVSPKFQINQRSYLNDVALQSCWWQKFTLKRHKNKFWSGTNIIWDNLKEGVWRLWSANTLSRPSYKSLLCNHVYDTIQNIIQNTYRYVKPMYSIKFHIIFKTYIHMQGPFCSTLTLTLILTLETQGRK